MTAYQIPPKYEALVKRAQMILPVSPTNLARELGLKVYGEVLGSRISGKLYKDVGASSGWAISVNSSEATTRQRFTIAHEIGHFVLHKDLVGELVEDDAFYRSNLSSKMEREANAFAADLLMPWELIDRLTREGVDSPSAIAARLNVSEVAMNIRLGMPT